MRYVKVQDVSHQLVSGCSPTFGWHRLISFHDLNRPQSAFGNPAGQTKKKWKPSLENVTNNDKIKSSALIKRGVYSPGHASCINKATTCRIPAHPVLVALRVCSEIFVLQHTHRSMLCHCIFLSHPSLSINGSDHLYVAKVSVIRVCGFCVNIKALNDLGPWCEKRPQGPFFGSWHWLPLTTHF